MPKIQITSKGIKRALKRYTPYQSIVEYIWNGFDAHASQIHIRFEADELGNLSFISIGDDGYGIPHEKLQDKFEPLFESKKALENKLKQNQSAIHGKNGIGRLTFFCFARNASWTTTYEKDAHHFTYDIFANSENINLYTGLSAVPRKTDAPQGTTVQFHGIHSLNGFLLGQQFEDFLLKEFAWFLALNQKRNYALYINDKLLDWKKRVGEIENFKATHEKSQTDFDITFVRWNEKNNNEPSRYYYLDSEGKERWKEATAIKNKGEQFYHSIYIQSAYFDAFGFQTNSQENQQPLLGGTRSDAQFKFLRKQVANFLRIKRRPFLKSFAIELTQEYLQKKYMPDNPEAGLAGVMQTLYEMQPRLFASLNGEQKKIFTGMLNLLLKSNQIEHMPGLVGSIVDLSSTEQEEIAKLFSRGS